MSDTIISALDIGGSKICCIIAQLRNKGDIKILGCGVRQSKGMEKGHINDLQAAQEPIREAVRSAEDMAKINIGDNIIVNIRSLQPKHRNVRHAVKLGGRTVGEEDMATLRNDIRYGFTEPDDYPLHCFEHGFRVDENDVLTPNPHLMNATQLSLQAYLLFVAKAHVDNLRQLMQHCGLRIGAIVYTPYVSALATLTPEEKRHGSIAIDMGAETTSFCVYHGGVPILCDIIGLGGHHITRAIAAGFAIPIKQAERLKTLYGSLLPGAPADKNHIGIRIGESVPTKGDLAQIIAPGIDEICRSLVGSLQDAGIAAERIHNMVITGGGANLPGMADIVSSLFSYPVRLAAPRGEISAVLDAEKIISGGTLAKVGTQFACIIGMLYYASFRDTMSVSASSAARSGFWRNLWRLLMKDPI